MRISHGLYGILIYIYYADKVSFEAKEDCIKFKCGTNDNVLNDTMKRSSHERKGSISNIVNVHATAILGSSPLWRFDEEEKIYGSLYSG